MAALEGVRAPSAGLGGCGLALCALFLVGFSALAATNARQVAVVGVLAVAAAVGPALLLASTFMARDVGGYALQARLLTGFWWLVAASGVSLLLMRAALLVLHLVVGR